MTALAPLSAFRREENRCGRLKIQRNLATQLVSLPQLCPAHTAAELALPRLQGANHPLKFCLNVGV